MQFTSLVFSLFYQPEVRNPMNLVPLISAKSLAKSPSNTCSVNTTIISMEINYRAPGVREHPRADAQPDSIHSFRFQNGTGCITGNLGELRGARTHSLADGGIVRACRVT